MLCFILTLFVAILQHAVIGNVRNSVSVETNYLLICLNFFADILLHFLCTTVGFLFRDSLIFSNINFVSVFIDGVYVVLTVLQSTSVAYVTVNCAMKFHFK